MRKKIKIKKRRGKYLKLIMVIILFLSSFYILFNKINNIQIFESSEEFVLSLLNKNTYTTFLKKLGTFITRINVNKPISILENSFYYQEELVFNDEYNPDLLNSSYIKDPNPTHIEKPIVYIYNSHQLENYSSLGYEATNITPNVMMASYMLKEKLNSIGIKTIVEEADITEFIRLNNWNYNYSYVASRYYIEDAIKNNPSLKFFIDLHRDALNKNYSTINIDGLECAKILFVVGLEHSNYEQNLSLANTLNEMIMNKYNGLSRGVLTKAGANVDGIYNQDLNPNMILLEMGGNENTIEEVSNTVNLIGPIIKEYLDEK